MMRNDQNSVGTFGIVSACSLVDLIIGRLARIVDIALQQQGIAELVRRVRLEGARAPLEQCRPLLTARLADAHASAS